MKCHVPTTSICKLHFWQIASTREIIHLYHHKVREIRTWNSFLSKVCIRGTFLLWSCISCGNTCNYLCFEILHPCMSFEPCHFSLFFADLYKHNSYKEICNLELQRSFKILGSLHPCTFERLRLQIKWNGFSCSRFWRKAGFIEWKSLF